MKLIISAAICITAIFIACGSGKNMAAGQAPFEQHGMEEQLPDSFLHKLQQENEVVLAYAIENTAWGHSIAYSIIAHKNNEWKGYNYSINVKHNTTINPVEVSATACDSVLAFFTGKEIWKIDGDKGRGACNDTSGKKNCIINDGRTWRLLVMTPQRVTRCSYYEPQFYEDCCPGNGERRLFLDAVEKIKQVFEKNNPGNNGSQM
jgi:hypothetical protein